MAFIDDVKAWFETGDKPTQAQFYSFFSKIRWKDEDISPDDIEDLITYLEQKLDLAQFEAYEKGQLIDYNGNAIYTIPEKTLLEFIIVFYGSAGTLKLSFVAYDGEDVLPSIDIASGWNEPITLNKVAIAEKDLYMTGIPAASKIIFFKRGIKTEEA